METVRRVSVQGAREVDIEQIVCETIMFLTLEVTRFPVATRFTKGQCNVNVIYNVCYSYLIDSFVLIFDKHDSS